MDNNVIRFRHRHRSERADEINEQACAWLAKLDSEAVGLDETRDQIGKWLAEDSAHVYAMMEMAALWDQLSILSELSEIFPLKNYEIELKSQNNKRRQSRRSLIVGTAMLLGGLIIGPFMFSGDDGEEFERGRYIYETAIGEQQTISLPDSSEIILNTNSLIEVTYSQLERNIFLQRGEAHFTVTKDVSRPFRVYAGLRVVEAVGTAFSVQRTINSDENDIEIEVLVAEGKVNFMPVSSDQEFDSSFPEPAINILNSLGVNLGAGEYASSNSSQSNLIVQSERLQVDEIEVRLAWRHGMLLFQGDSLEQVLEEVNRYTTIQIEADSAIKDMRVEGYFRTGDIDALLLAMENNFNIDVQRVNENYIYLTAQ
ncbi:MAG: hypothetical protein CMQ38_12010 [Gammaproteobacteria bacterium]|nr:hypothetical protein [Gammaproteobacteria bacterium]